MDDDDEGPLVLPPDGNGLPTVGVGPQSTGGKINCGIKLNNACKCGANNDGFELHKGVSAERKFVKCTWLDGASGWPVPVEPSGGW